MSQIEHLDPNTERFIEAHRRAVEMLAHVLPLDITIQVEMPLTEGRVTLAATEQPPTITETEYQYRPIATGMAIRKTVTTISLNTDGGVVAVGHDEIDAPDADTTTYRWPNYREETEVLDNSGRSLAMEEVFGAVDELYELVPEGAD